MPVYVIRENNSGGKFVGNDDECNILIISAKNATEANEIAENSGVYFHGCDHGCDCPCCGDRWYEVDEFDSVKNVIEALGDTKSHGIKFSMRLFGLTVGIYNDTGLKAKYDDPNFNSNDFAGTLFLASL